MLPIPGVRFLLGSLIGLAAFLVAVYDLYCFFTDDQHRRFGDELGQTIVVIREPIEEMEPEQVAS